MLEYALKQFLDAIEKGELRRDLFLFSHRVHLQLFKLELCDDASNRGMNPLTLNTRDVIHVGDSQAVLAVSHPNFDRRFSGITWTAVHGLDHLDEKSATHVMARVQP